MVIMNTFILHNKYVIGNKKSILEVRMEIIKNLLTQQGNVAELNQMQQQPTADHLPTKSHSGKNNKTLRRRCVVCYKNAKRKDTGFQCKACEGTPALCLGDCFKKYHETR